MTAEAAKALEAKAIRAITDSDSRLDVIAPYTECLRSQESINFNAINAAVIDRWSETVLEWVKLRAWEIIEDRGKDASDGG